MLVSLALKLVSVIYCKKLALYFQNIINENPGVKTNFCTCPYSAFCQADENLIKSGKEAATE